MLMINHPCVKSGYLPILSELCGSHKHLLLHGLAQNEEQCRKHQASHPQERMHTDSDEGDARTADSSGSVSLLSNVQIVSGVAPHSHNLYIIMKMQGRPAFTLPSLTGESLEPGPGQAAMPQVAATVRA
eukprot:scaffold3342_cov135-Isochrysis_galbana.AAC.6